MKVSNQISGAYFTCCLPLVWINFRQHLHSTNINTSAATLKCQLSPPLIHWGYKGRESLLKFLVNDKITTSCSTNMPPKYQSNMTNLKFVHMCLLLIVHVLALGSYFYDLLNLVAVGQLLNFDTFWDTAHIILVTFPRILPLVIAHRCL